jgi:chromosome partitioning protein
VPVLTVCNHKGGTGKTTTSIHLAAALGRQGRRVLVVDLDPQGFLTRMLGAPDPEPEHSALGLLDATADLRSFPVHSVSGFDLVGSSMALTKALRRLTRPTDVLWLRETVRAGHDYDLILIDTAAALSVYTMNALVASDHVVIPVTPEYQPVVGAEQTWQTSGLVQDKLNPQLATPRFLLTQVDARLNRHARYAEYLRAKYGEAVLSTAIRTSSSLAVASRDGRTVFDSKHSTRGAVDYTAAAEEIAGYVFGDAPVPEAPTVEATAAPPVEGSPAKAPAPPASAPPASAPPASAPPASAPPASAVPLPEADGAAPASPAVGVASAAAPVFSRPPIPDAHRPAPARDPFEDAGPAGAADWSGLGRS